MEKSLRSFNFTLGSRRNHCLVTIQSLFLEVFALLFNTQHFIQTRDFLVLLEPHLLSLSWMKAHLYLLDHHLFLPE
ncbi:hypothetical protein H4I96_10465 [Botrytis cinerea]